MKYPGIIEIDKLEYDDNSEENLKNWREKETPFPKINGFSVDFTGHNQGSGSPCKDMQEVNERVKRLIQEHQEDHKIKIINHLEVQQTL